MGQTVFLCECCCVLLCGGEDLREGTYVERDMQICKRDLYARATLWGRVCFCVCCWASCVILLAVKTRERAHMSKETCLYVKETCTQGQLCGAELPLKHVVCCSVLQCVAATAVT